MGKLDRRLRILESGDLEVVDPGYDEDLELIRSIDPEFEIASADLPGFTRPRVFATRARSVALSHPPSEVSTSTLWSVHAAALSQPVTTAEESSVTLLDVKIELARRMLSSCNLCAHRCGVDRLRGEQGKCLLGIEAKVAEHFVHIGEEPPINPSMVISLGACGLRCRFCQQHRILVPDRFAGLPLDADLWPSLANARARSLTFVGGNPDESLLAILRFLREIPSDWSLPVVWNNHAYSTPEVLALLEGVVDVYIPDFKFGADACAERLSGAKSYTSVASEAVRTMLGQGVPVYVRVLVLPGHNKCCHLPTLKRLSRFISTNLFISLRDQYSPDHRIHPGDAGEQDAPLNRRVNSEEMSEIRSLAGKLALHVIGTSPLVGSSG